MAKEHIIPITNGQGSIALVNDTYNVATTTTGYDITTILPTSVEITEGVNEYNFTVAATGTLTIHVTDDGTDSGNPIIGATFVRCDATGNIYGNEIISSNDGNAVFNAVPYALENSPFVYYKQISSDGQHNFNQEIQNTTLTTATSTIEITNHHAATRSINFTDATYNGLPIVDGELTLSTE